MPNHCGPCTACCKVYSIPAIAKPAGKWCQHCTVGVGCQVYEARPEACIVYECFWLQSQRREKPLGPELRPDRCKVVVAPTTNDAIMGAITLPGAPDAWKRGPIHKLLTKFVEAGMGVAIGAPGASTQLKWTSKGIREVQMTAPDKDGMQYSINGGDDA